ncbi:hypothetical protein [Actinacidiphila oryziradicis]|uniref:N-acylglucosamine 2-epimerase n=1 Tax=Actinacidiphila oryziradicis TaxID=2571141 RepID=A0A4U0SXC1_9ACTN|nr:hypothetical protein [Actinacidiphila oryziradicis]TKA12757.1 hypothetical protein FCI23_05220 [Actinacidiphila oryziradicis]
MTITRLTALAHDEPLLHALATRLLAVAEAGLPAMYRAGADTFVFTRTAKAAPDGSWSLEQRGTSTRYAAITALGARFLPEDRQRAVLGGHTAEDFTGLLIERLPAVTNLGDAALIAWAAAETEHPKLSDALARVAALDEDGGPRYTVEAAWVLSALAAARGAVDVEDRFSSARDRLLRARIGDGPLFPHATGPGLVPWYRAHVSCFADQTYPLQALARAHASGGDPEALAASEACAARICALQGDGGQWWWHYDARTGGVVEGYPVYSVHQHAMAPTALFDLAEAGGTDFGASIRSGLRWMADVPELAAAPESMILDEPGVTWRKVYRGDPKKAVRAARGIGTRVAPGLRLGPLDRLFRPASLDRECRPYEFGWMLFAWLGGRI